tara:strand:- start:660 stop:1046 length:387 start_codon:yes stop_codon:yes gene_type:complete
MAIGIVQKNGSNISGFSAAVVPDKGLQQSAKPRVLKAQFGDGYEMRVRDGINNTPREWQLSFKTRTKADIDNLYDFFNGLASVDTCKLTVPFDGGESTAVVVIEDYSRTLEYDEFYSLSCKAREVFEA